MIFQQSLQQLQLLGNLISSLSDEQFIRQIRFLGKASIGGHTRHIIELFQCTVNGYTSGGVDYFNRTRDLRLERDKIFAFCTIEQLKQDVRLPDKQLRLSVEQTDSVGDSHVLTTYSREIIYNTEHAIHHLALIKVALMEIGLDIVDKDLGMSYSTIKYKATLKNVESF